MNNAREKNMIGLYFSGTGNSKYAVETFLQAYKPGARAYAIEDKRAIEELSKQEEIVFGYSVQYSSEPKLLYDFIEENARVWKKKKVFVIATMGLFSGDGAGVLARHLKKYDAEILGGLHLKMPDSIADEKVLKRSERENRKLVEHVKSKVTWAAIETKKGNPPREGLTMLNRLAGFLGQRLYFGYKTKHYSNKLKIDMRQCVSCGKCIHLCPTGNIMMNEGTIRGSDKCTMCYRCVNHCPKQAITILGRQVVTQSTIEKYIK